MAREPNWPARSGNFGGGPKRRFEDERSGGCFQADGAREGRSGEGDRREVQMQDRLLRERGTYTAGNERIFTEEDNVGKRRVMNPRVAEHGSEYQGRRWGRASEAPRNPGPPTYVVYTYVYT